MRNKVAKQLRKITKITKGVDNVEGSYDVDRQEKFLGMDYLTRKPLYAVTDLSTLTSDCPRNFYKKLKTVYKSGVAVNSLNGSVETLNKFLTKMEDK
jgi:hypothetical protein